MSHFSNGYAVAIVRNGSVVETRQDGQVAVPFGGDYAVRLINKNSRRAVATIHIDGRNVSGNGFIVPAFGSVDITRPADKPVNFRFASVDSGAAAAHGKAGPDVDGSKGLVLVEWRPERYIPPYSTGYLGAYAGPASTLSNRGHDYEYDKSTLHSRKPADTNQCTPRRITKDSGTLSMNAAVPTCGGIVLPDTNNIGMSFAPSPEPKRELSSGVTVEGGYSSQTFNRVHFTVDENVPVTVTTLKLMGYTEAEGIPINGTAKCPECRTKTAKNTDKFCRNCGYDLRV